MEQPPRRRRPLKPALALLALATAGLGGLHPWAEDSAWPWRAPKAPEFGVIELPRALEDVPADAPKSAEAPAARPRPTVDPTMDVGDTAWAGGQAAAGQAQPTSSSAAAVPLSAEAGIPTQAPRPAALAAPQGPRMYDAPSDLPDPPLMRQPPAAVRGAGQTTAELSTGPRFDPSRYFAERAEPSSLTLPQGPVSAYAGTWEGTSSGGAPGRLVLVVQPTGTFRATLSMGPQSASATGTVSSQGQVMMSPEYSALRVTGALDEAAGEASGRWSIHPSPLQGSWQLTRVR